MAIYVIGDVQGCYQELQQLLRLIVFNPTTDTLGFVGDLVNRGPQSLEVLRFVKQLPSSKIVLGNHDLFLLMLGYGCIPQNAYPHTLNNVLAASDKLTLLDWLRYQPLMRYEKAWHTVLVHAGLPPQWNITQSLQYADEVAQLLQGPHYRDFLTHLFGNTPAQWSPQLIGQARSRYITNVFTRMRFVDVQGELDLQSDQHTSIHPERFQPWFSWRDADQDDADIVFGHWAALGGQCSAKHCYALDTGCAWGYALTALRLEDKKRFHVPCDHYYLSDSSSKRISS